MDNVHRLYSLCWGTIEMVVGLSPTLRNGMWNDGRSGLRIRPLTLPDVLPSDSARHGQVYCKGPRTALSRGKSIRGVKGSLRPYSLHALTVLRVVCFPCLRRGLAGGRCLQRCKATALCWGTPRRGVRLTLRAGRCCRLQIRFHRPLCHSLER